MKIATIDRIDNLNFAIAEAERFITAAGYATDILRDAQALGGPNMARPGHAQAKRASMDLTRALVDVRR